MSRQQPVVTVSNQTAAGDTFNGFFLGELMLSGDPVSALTKGCLAHIVLAVRFTINSGDNYATNNYLLATITSEVEFNFVTNGLDNGSCFISSFF